MRPFGNGRNHPLSLGEGAKREPDRAKPQEKVKGLRIRGNLNPSLAALRCVGLSQKERLVSNFLTEEALTG